MTNKTDNVKKEAVKALWESQLGEIFQDHKKTEMEEFLNIISIIVYDRFDKNISKLYTTIDNIELFTKLINTFSGMTVKFPEREEFKNATNIALTYFYKEVKNMSWTDIKKELPYDASLPLKTGKAIIELNKSIKESIEKLLCEKGFSKKEEK